MTPNPYQSPQEAGYDARRPARLPLWRRVVRAALLSVAFVWAGWIFFFVCAVALDYLRWQVGF